MLSPNQYVHMARIAVQCAAIVVLMIFLALSYQRLMNSMVHSSPEHDMSAMQQTAPSECEVMCLFAAADDWMQFLQSLFVSMASVLWTVVVVFAVLLYRFVVIANNPIEPDRIRRLSLYYAHQRWKYRLWYQWHSIFQNGLLPLRLYASQA
jgi:hypothetical protein